MGNSLLSGRLWQKASDGSSESRPSAKVPPRCRLCTPSCRSPLSAFRQLYNKLGLTRPRVTQCARIVIEGAVGPADSVS
jgi:hypothetical protein